MKRTTLSSVVMASLMVSTITVPAFAGRGGGSGGHSQGGGNGGGKSFGENFAARSTANFHPQAQVMQKFNGNVNKVAANPQFTQKLTNVNAVGNHSIGNHSIGNHSIGNHLQGISNKGLKGNVLQASGHGNMNPGNSVPNGKNQGGKNNWWCSTPSKSCGNWYPGKYCGYFGCYPYFGCSSNYGCYPYSGCYSNWWYPTCYSYPTCGYNYSYYNCSYGPQYCSPLSVTPVSYGTSGVAASASSPVVVNVDARDADQLLPSSPVAKPLAADKLAEMKLGGTYALPGSGFGTKAGQMFVEIGDVALGVRVDDWDDQKVSFTLPMIGLSKATDAKLHLVSSEGKEVKSADVRLVMPTQLTAKQ